MIHLGFVTSKNDTSLFISHSSHGLLLVLVYVDDIIIIGSHFTQVNHLIQLFHHQFSLKDLGHLHYFLGLEVHRIPITIHLSKKKYITDLLTRAAMLDAKPFLTSMSPTRISLFMIVRLLKMAQIIEALLVPFSIVP